MDRVVRIDEEFLESVDNTNKIPNDAVHSDQHQNQSLELNDSTPEDLEEQTQAHPIVTPVALQKEIIWRSLMLEP